MTSAVPQEMRPGSRPLTTTLVTGTAGRTDWTSTPHAAHRTRAKAASPWIDRRSEHPRWPERTPAQRKRRQVLPVAASPAPAALRTTRRRRRVGHLPAGGGGRHHTPTAVALLHSVFWPLRAAAARSASIGVFIHLCAVAGLIFSCFAISRSESPSSARRCASMRCSSLAATRARAA